MFPKADEPEPSRAQGGLVFPVAFDVELNLLGPVRGVRPRRLAAPRAAVPEAAVSEHRDLLRPERELRRTRHVLGVNRPASDLRLDQQPAQPPLRAAVAGGADRLHVPGALRGHALEVAAQYLAQDPLHGIASLRATPAMNWHARPVPRPRRPPVRR